MGMAAAESQFHVLAVDDSLIDRKLIEKLLKTSSYQVTTVDSGSKALEFLGFREEEEQSSSSDSPSVSSNNHQICPSGVLNFPWNHQEVEVNLIITDYCMPGMTGYDLLKKIKESSSLRNIPVVIMSSENVPSRISRCLEEGAEEFFLKPVQLSDLHRLRHHMMRTKKQEKQENQEEEGESENKAEVQPQSSHQAQQQSNNSSSSSSSSNKRKAMDEGLSPDRTRPRYSNGVTTAV
ncbi:two-component response regulator ORR9 isoform X1 [Punica granatum]|uniref:Two-component response regulator ORR9 isoform X1 n=1 Tax=Punica granatum TaxID=22663 RepID=A0A218XLB4_PUNGR|nr:two-component response regulator ORR9 isoform X1 [Punica granatum]OWM85466.1 hypothetical protein CDL15_Pgr019090 [Punica granatum]